MFITQALQLQERNTTVKPGMPSSTGLVGNVLPKFSSAAISNHHNGGIKNGHIPSAAERELSGIKDIQRGKSFLEARTAVQKHIEKMLNHNNGVSNNQQGGASSPLQSPPNMTQSPLISSNIEALNRNKFELLDQVKHTMHGVSHAIPGMKLIFLSYEDGLVINGRSKR